MGVLKGCGLSTLPLIHGVGNYIPDALLHVQQIKSSTTLHLPPDDANEGTDASWATFLPYCVCVSTQQ